MKIAIDISPLKTGHFLQHRVRGTGFYLENLRNSLEKNFPENNYQFFTRGDKLDSDIDIIHYPYFEPFFLTLHLKKQGKTVVTVHDLTPLVFPTHFPAGIKGKIKWQMQRHILRHVDMIITDSQSSKKDIMRFVGVRENKLAVVYLAASEIYRKLTVSITEEEELRKKYDLPRSFGLYVGDVTWNKNLPRLVHAAEKSKVPLVMVGKALVDEDFDKANSWNKDLAEVQTLLTRNRNIVYPGFVSIDELVKLYNIATFFIMPSLYEGFGLPILEAMQCGCPVITTKEGSIPEVAGNAAYYVDAYNTNSIADGMEKLFVDKQLQLKHSKLGLEQSKKFTWKKTAEETMNIYQNVVTHER